MLAGKSVVLRPLKKEDLAKTNEWRNDLNLIKLTQGYRLPKTIEMDEDWFNRVLHDTNDRNVFFGIEMIDTGEFIGIIQLNHIDYVSGTAIWGLVIGDKEHRGKGYSPEALSLLVDYAFNTLNLRKLWSYLLDGNKASKKLHEKLGFTIEGCLKEHVYYDSKYHDVFVMSLFKKDASLSIPVSL